LAEEMLRFRGFLRGEQVLRVWKGLVFFGRLIGRLMGELDMKMRCKEMEVGELVESVIGGLKLLESRMWGVD
jgi:hypothetical protein